MEPWLRPALTLAAAVALPLLTSALMRRLTPARVGNALGSAATPVLALLAWLGATALGPELVDAPYGVPSWGFGLATAVVGLGTFALPLVRHRRDESSPPSGQLPETATAAVGLVTSMKGAVVGVVVVAAVATLWPLTRVDPDEPDADAALLRTRIDPWDGDAWLARAWAAHRAGHRRYADTFAARAVRAGIDRASAMVFQAERLASEGKCDEAHAAFEESLRMRAEAALEANERLTLGSHRLPPSLTLECEASAE